ncbi:protein kinase domain-containing protein [Haematococcus lacustris]|uniref:Protein kinase domain-containing protein n=1 Tax=Haematococcus lacustris TaxID=44745 RepID=A0A699Z3A2_HAELA|nr:protein kinase domain-containing protein [Haematococcus lacustris]
MLRRSSSFQSEEGFGDPLGRPSNLGDIRDMLHLIGAKPKQHITQMIMGMFHLHSANVIHGDLKPANVLLMNSRKDRRGFVARVSDFGLAQYCPAAGQVLNAPWGTLVFMAPERFKGNILSTASDVWSFGVILWQMYTAQLPYQGAKQAELMKGIINGSLTLTWPSGAPPPLVAFAGRCMSYNASERPSFEALMHELALMESEP